MAEHRAYAEPSNDRVQVVFAGEVIADSEATKLLYETGHQPVRYFPPDDVRTEVLTPTDHHTRCPIKGEASYYTLEAGGHTAENAAWYYPDPLPDASGVPGYLAFYPDVVEIAVLQPGDAAV